MEVLSNADIPIFSNPSDSFAFFSFRQPWNAKSSMIFVLDGTVISAIGQAAKQLAPIYSRPSDKLTFAIPIEQYGTYKVDCRDKDLRSHIKKVKVRAVNEEKENPNIEDLIFQEE